MKKKILLFIIMLLSTSVFSQENAVDLNTKGIEYAKKGQIDKAFNLFENSIKIDPIARISAIARAVFANYAHNENQIK